MKIAIGIDTGGTSTDAVLYDLDSGTVLGCGKALTTHHDLTQGILAALDMLDPALCRQATVAGLSTTLATNACVESKFRKTRLLLMGIDRDGIARFGADYGLRDPDAICYLPCKTTITGQILEEPDWQMLRTHAKEWFHGMEGCAVCEIYGIRNGGVLEKKAAKILQEETGLSTVCASQLFSGLSSLERSTSALLNAGLLPVMQEFLTAVQTAFACRDIRAELFITRSDSTLMNLDYAAGHAVETLLSGPAASVLGGSVLTGQAQAVVVDMGGTTTDIALIQDGAPLMSENGIRIGGWRTQVSGLASSSFALGGDSVIRWDRTGALTLGPQRVIPLCLLASRYPETLSALEQQVRTTPYHTLPLHEFLVLNRPDWDSLPLNEEDRRLCLALTRCPLNVEQAAALMNTDRYNLSTAHLEQTGVLLRAGLTPTDIMHLRGDYTPYETKASRLGAQFTALSTHLSIDALCEQIYETVSETIFYGIADTLLQQASPYCRKHGLDDGIRELLRLQWNQRREEHPLLRCAVTTPAVLIGVGGPTHIFLPEAARALGTEFCIPSHAPVANATGAIAGRMAVCLSAEIRPCGADDALTHSNSFEVLCPDESPRRFPEESDAVRWATETLQAAAAALLRQRGGQGTAHFRVSQQESIVKTHAGYLKLGIHLQVSAETYLIEIAEGRSHV